MTRIDSRTVAIIPARGGSRGIPRKNIRPLAGKPLIAWSIEDALAVPEIAAVYVSTDAKEIAEVSQAYGAQAIMRPAALAGDLSTSEEALLHALDCLRASGADPDTVVFLQATSPLRGAKHIRGALELFKSSQADSLLSVIPSHAFIWQEQADGSALPLNYNPLTRPLRQQMQQFKENGSLYVFKSALLRETGCRLGGRIVMYRMPAECAADIDTLDDWTEVEKRFLNQA